MSDDTKQNESNAKRTKKLVGVVVSSKAKDTAVVAVTRYVKHPKYKKYIKRVKRYQVHDVGNAKEVGARVEIRETKPVSKTKHFEMITEL